MRKIKYRSIPTGLFAFSMLLAATFLGFSIFAVRVYAHDGVPREITYLFGAFIVCVFLIPSLVWMVFLLKHFFTVFTVTEESLTVRRPFQPPTSIPVTEIGVFGVVSFIPQGTKLFFCTRSKAQIEEYFYDQTDACKRMYGEAIFNQYAQSPEGRQKMAMGLYIRNKCPGLFILDHGSPNRLSQIVTILRQPAMLTGPWLLQHEGDWKQYIVPGKK